MAADQIKQVRRFNRTVAERVGVLQDHYLDGTRPYGQARLLWQIGDGETHDVRSVRARLGLDSGYASRLLRALERDGLVTVETHAEDRRVRTVRLTEAGWRERTQLDARSDALAASLLDPLDAKQRDRLLAAMEEVERLLTASTVSLDVLDPDHPDAVHCLRGFTDELGALFGFDPANSLLPDPGELRTPRGLFLVARLHGEPVGAAGLKLPADAPAEVKRLWVSPRARGLGLAKRILTTLEQQAVSHGRDLVRLDTNKALAAAIHLYRTNGYTEIPAFNDEPYAHHWFEKRLPATA
ncbi:helix-turn-helix domain-containing GNAT family N-acetyltransferase [Streptomyces castrisilvae]|uniref:Helix-turn-helix domain-containing GNAT family N-acetyltransferase n=1 Tax=Streptomyces castrisilvae TaxID=3033811 RepID=A0ABY9HJW8_9ACTN|nr:helix-turn-helix domain-containing GNAT family N-acetyltransferase [Streptomyces sp. Mut1]WLQ34852.1 helix-turn-helix domain-containing GNAT family N-acetyltransferase [Streptomyces sp. Mut1]